MTDNFLEKCKKQFGLFNSVLLSVTNLFALIQELLEGTSLIALD